MSRVSTLGEPALCRERTDKSKDLEVGNQQQSWGVSHEANVRVNHLETVQPFESAGKALLHFLEQIKSVLKRAVVSPAFVTRYHYSMIREFSYNGMDGFRPCRKICIGDIPQSIDIRTFNKTSAKKDSLSRKPDNNIVVCVSSPRKETFSL